MTTQHERQNVISPPLWIIWLIALVPVFPPLHFASLSVLRYLVNAQKSAKYVMTGFFVTQLASSAFTDNPVLSLFLNGLHSFLVLSVISVGLYLKNVNFVTPVIYGQIFIIISSWIFTLASNDDATGRLSGPYYHSVSLGFTATILIWLTFYSNKSYFFKVTVITIALITLFSTESRGAIIALFLGFLGAILTKKLRMILFSSLCIFMIFPIALRDNTALFDHISGRGLSHRDIVWSQALTVWHENALGGVGLYQVGPHITQLMTGGCSLTQAAETAGVSCPKSSEALISANLTAHNLIINQGLSTGFIGLIGFLSLFIYFASKIIQLDSQPINAILFGYTFMNIFDVTIILPTLHYGELFWIFCGLSLTMADRKNENKISDITL